MTGWNEHGHAVMTGLPIDRYLGSGDLQDAENCGYAPVSVLAELGVDRSHGDPQIQYRNGRIVLLDGTVLERGGTLNCVWAVTSRPRYTEADVEALAAILHDARTHGIQHGNYTQARWILDRWEPPANSKVDVLLADGTHRYWSTHCRHDNHEACSATEITGTGTTLRGVRAQRVTIERPVSIERRPAQCKTCAAPCSCSCHKSSTEEGCPS